MSKVKGQGHKEQKRAVHSQHPRAVDGMHALVADNVADNASSRRDDLIVAEGCLRLDACAGPGGLPHF